MDKNKKIILTIIAVLILCVGSTLAYIIASLQDEARGNASVTSDAVDILRFEIDKDISLNPTQFNVVEGGDNLSDTSVGSAILRANSTDNNAKYNYYVYFQINSNNYIYTTEEQTPEIVLTITDPEGNPVTSISGLDYVTSGGVSGFDITTKTGLYTVAELYEITSGSSVQDTIQDWTFTVSFINLDTNQAENGGKTLEAEIILSRKPRYTLASYITNELYTGIDGENGLYLHDADMDYGSLVGTTYNERYILSEKVKNDFPGYSGVENDFIKFYCNGILQDIGSECSSSNQYYIVADNNEYTYSSFAEAISEFQYFSDNDYQYIIDTERISAHDNSLRFTGGDYEVSEEYTNDYAYVLDAYDGDPNKTGVVKYYCNLDPEFSFADMPCGDGYFYLAYNDSVHYDNKLDAIKKAISDGYIIANVNNYVCFGSDEGVCPYNNLYRIIGVFDGQVKLIKADYMTIEESGTNGAYYNGFSDLNGNFIYYKGYLSADNISTFYWNSLGTNNWATSNLNLINLNTNYLNYLNQQDKKWNDMIDLTLWHLGGYSGYSVYATPGLMIDFEKSENIYNGNSVNYSSKVALMYISDLAYASAPEYWTNDLNQYLAVETGIASNENNWSYLGLYEWFITHNYNNAIDVYYLNSMGMIIGNGTVNNDMTMVIRPTFYLKPSVLITSGDGSIDNPYRIEI